MFKHHFCARLCLLSLTMAMSVTAFADPVIPSAQPKDSKPLWRQPARAAKLGLIKLSKRNPAQVAFITGSVVPRKIEGPDFSKDGIKMPLRVTIAGLILNKRLGAKSKQIWENTNYEQAQADLVDIIATTSTHATVRSEAKYYTRLGKIRALAKQLRYKKVFREVGLGAAQEMDGFMTPDNQIQAEPNDEDAKSQWKKEFKAAFNRANKHALAGLKKLATTEQINDVFMKKAGFEDCIAKLASDLGFTAELQDNGQTIVLLKDGQVAQTITLDVVKTTLKDLLGEKHWAYGDIDNLEMTGMHSLTPEESRIFNLGVRLANAAWATTQLARAKMEQSPARLDPEDKKVSFGDMDVRAAKVFRDTYATHGFLKAFIERAFWIHTDVGQIRSAIADEQNAQK